MRKRLLAQLSKINTVPSKVLRRQRFLQRSKAKRQHEHGYSNFAYSKSPKPGRFNRWQSYKRLNGRYF